MKPAIPRLKPETAAPLTSLPHANHPALRDVVDELAGIAGLEPDLAAMVLTAVQRGLGITDLDIEMCQPGSAPRVPFAAAGSGYDRDGEYQAMVRAHLVKIEGARR